MTAHGPHVVIQNDGQQFGQPWDTYDKAPCNLYNVLWRGQQVLARRIYRKVP